MLFQTISAIGYNDFDLFSLYGVSLIHNQWARYNIKYKLILHQEKKKIIIYTQLKPFCVRDYM